MRNGMILNPSNFRDPCIIHLSIATCKWWFPFISVLKKPCFKRLQDVSFKEPIQRVASFRPKPNGAFQPGHSSCASGCAPRRGHPEDPDPCKSPGLSWLCRFGGTPHNGGGPFDVQKQKKEKNKKMGSLKKANPVKHGQCHV